jgi:hypothetical protein
VRFFGVIRLIERSVSDVLRHDITNPSLTYAYCYGC